MERHMLGLRVDNQIRSTSTNTLVEDRIHSQNATMLGLCVDKFSPPSPTTKEVAITFSVGCKDDASQDAAIFTLIFFKNNRSLT